MFSDACFLELLFPFNKKVKVDLNIFCVISLFWIFTFWLNILFIIYSIKSRKPYVHLFHACLQKNQIQPDPLH